MAEGGGKCEDCCKCLGRAHGGLHFIRAAGCEPPARKLHSSSIACPVPAFRRHANLVQRVEMEERIMGEAPFCFLFVAALSLMMTSMVYAFDTEKMASVHRLLTDSVSHRFQT